MDPGNDLYTERLRERHRISEIKDQTKSIWESKGLSQEDNLLMQKVADLLKDEPKALHYAMEALADSKEREA